MHPSTARTVVDASNDVGTAVGAFQDRLGITSSRQVIEGRRWSDAASEVTAKALQTGGQGVGVAVRVGKSSASGVRSAGAEVARRAGDAPRLRRSSRKDAEKS